MLHTSHATVDIMSLGHNFHLKAEYFYTDSQPAQRN